MDAKVLQIETPECFGKAVEAAVSLLRAGEVVAVPTETVYGLAANALDSDAVRKIYAAKGRPPENPVIVHVASLEMARMCVGNWIEDANKLAARFWPGPLTLVLPKAECIPRIVTAGGETVGVRWPLHPFMQEVIRACDFPLAAPSANRANQISPTTAEHVRAGLGSQIPLIVDAGPSSVGIESTVIDLSVSPRRLLRPGMISREELEAVLGQAIAVSDHLDKTLRSPGLLKRHYSPKARLHVRSWNDERELLEIARLIGVPFSAIHIIAYEVIPRTNPFGRVAIIPHDAEAYARALYLELHRCDELGAQTILVEQVPDEGGWAAIRDRLKRASAESEAA